ncbi:hypothetical protein [Aestuariivivens insulae]|uniref:hypothetical protein n=1 Tax=Aestuariivivens insulae TaxID=1621988 RepID=UPI001F55C492|nr:hypothetical protein [Aestuariivivens insulae]
MNVKHKSIFNLIEIFKGKGKEQIKSISSETHCEQKQIHDYYCDAEKPHVALASV